MPMFTNKKPPHLLPHTCSQACSQASNRVRIHTLALMLPIILLLIALPLAAVDVMQFDSPEQAERFRALTEEIRCLVCQNQSLADSDAPLAQDLRDEVLEQMNAGKTDGEIRDYLVARYSDFVLYRPRINSANLVLWFAPLLMVLAGFWIIYRQLRKRSAIPADKSTDDPTDNNQDQ